MTSNSQANDRPASFDAAVLQWLPFLRKVARKYAITEHQQEDLVNDTVVAALVRWRGYDPAYKLTNWLVYQMRERNYEMRRKEIRQKNLRQDAAMPTADKKKTTKPNQEAHADAALVVDAIASLSPRRRDLICRIAIGEKKHEIAEASGVSNQAIDQQVNVVRRQLRTRMGLGAAERVV